MPMILGTEPALVSQPVHGTEPLARCVLPLGACPLQNVYARMHWTKKQKVKRDAFMRMLSQIGKRDEPLTGKPWVRITRCSSKAPDADAGVGAKVPLDCLKADKQGLGWILDDSPAHIALELRWQKAAPSRGQVVVEVFA